MLSLQGYFIYYSFMKIEIVGLCGADILLMSLNVC